MSGATQPSMLMPWKFRPSVVLTNAAGTPMLGVSADAAGPVRNEDSGLTRSANSASCISLSKRVADDLRPGWALRAYWQLVLIAFTLACLLLYTLLLRPVNREQTIEDVRVARPRIFFFD